MAMAAKAKELKAAGKTVYDLSVGEPDFNTPPHICQAAVEAIHAGHTHYTAASGIPELILAVVDEYQAVHGLEYTPRRWSSPTGPSTPCTTCSRCFWTRATK